MKYYLKVGAGWHKSLMRLITHTEIMLKFESRQPPHRRMVVGGKWKNGQLLEYPDPQAERMKAELLRSEITALELH